jgi:hypothetical protein
MGCGSSKPQTTTAAAASGASKSAPKGAAPPKKGAGKKFDTDYKRGSTVSFNTSDTFYFPRRLVELLRWGNSRFLVVAIRIRKICKCIVFAA